MFYSATTTATVSVVVI